MGSVFFAQNKQHRSPVAAVIRVHNSEPTVQANEKATSRSDARHYNKKK